MSKVQVFVCVIVAAVLVALTGFYGGQRLQARADAQISSPASRPSVPKPHKGLYAYSILERSTKGKYVGHVLGWVLASNADDAKNQGVHTVYPQLPAAAGWSVVRNGINVVGPIPDNVLREALGQ